MGFRRIRNQPKRLRAGNFLQEPTRDQVKYQKSVHKIPGFRQEVYHSTLRTGNPYPVPKIGDPEFTASPWDEIRLNFHSFGETADGVFKVLWQKLYLDPLVYDRNAWGNTLTQSTFKWSESITNKVFNTTNELSAGQGDIHDHSYTWGEMRIENPEKSTGGDGRFWFYFRHTTGTMTTVAITKMCAFKYGALVKEYPLVELYPPPVNGVVPTPNLSNDSGYPTNTKYYYRKTARHWNDSTTPSTYLDMVDENWNNYELTIEWADNDHGDVGYYVGTRSSTTSWPNYWDHSPARSGDGGGNGIVNGETPYLYWRARSYSTPYPVWSTWSINHLSTYLTPNNLSQSQSDPYVNPEPP